MAMKSDVVEELRIDDSDFDRVRHLFPPPYVRAHCGSIDRTKYKGEFFRGQADAEVCVVCLEIERSFYGS